MNLVGWAAGAWADGSWVPESWGEQTETPQQRVIIVGGGADLSWESHVKALHEKRQLENQVKQYERQIKKVERRIRKIEKEASKPEHPAGILANLLLLEEKKTELEAKVQEVHDMLITLDWLVEAVEIEDDEEEVMLLVS